MSKERRGDGSGSRHCGSVCCRGDFGSSDESDEEAEAEVTNAAGAGANRPKHDLMLNTDVSVPVASLAFILMAPYSYVHVRFCVIREYLFVWYHVTKCCMQYTECKSCSGIGLETNLCFFCCRDNGISRKRLQSVCTRFQGLLCTVKILTYAEDSHDVIARLYVSCFPLVGD